MTKLPTNSNQTEAIDDQLQDLELLPDQTILNVLATSQLNAANAAQQVIPELAKAVADAAKRLGNDEGRLIMVGAGASGRLAVQDGAELWPTYGWPHDRLVLSIAGGNNALLKSIDGFEDSVEEAENEINGLNLGANDVVVALAASGRSAWTVAWATQARKAGALTIGVANNQNTPLLAHSEHAIWLNSGAEVLAGSTRMAAGTAQKIVLNMFSTLLMIRLNRTYGNLMVDMAASNVKLDERRLAMLYTIVPDLDKNTATEALKEADGWVKLAALLCLGLTKEDALTRLENSAGSLRTAMQ